MLQEEIWQRLPAALVLEIFEEFIILVWQRKILCILKNLGVNSAVFNQNKREKKKQLVAK